MRMVLQTKPVGEAKREEVALAQAERNKALIEYIAIMADIDIDTEDEEDEPEE